MSLLYNMLSRLVITFLPRSERLLISWLQSPSEVILEPKKTYMKQWTGSKSERSTSRLCIVTLLIYLICRAHHVKCQLGEAQAGIKIAGRNIYNLRYANNTTHMAESEELKNLLMKVKEESEKLA